MSRISTMASLIAAAVLAGCRPPDTSRPPNIRFGEEACAECRMIIDDERFAAALVTSDGEALKFDDVGCLIQHEADRVRSDVGYWVRDFQGREWLDARGAAFVHSAKVASPMGFGLAALAAGSATGEPAGPGLRFSDLPSLVAERSRESGVDR